MATTSLCPLSRALSKGVFPSSSLKSGLAPCRRRVFKKLRYYNLKASRCRNTTLMGSLYHDCTFIKYTATGQERAGKTRGQICLYGFLDHRY